MAHATGGSQCGDGSRQHADDNLQDSLPSTFLHFLLHLRFNILVNNTLSWLPESHLQLTCKAVETAEFTEGLLSLCLHSNSQLQVCKCKGTKKSWHFQIFYKLFSKKFAIKKRSSTSRALRDYFSASEGLLLLHWGTTSFKYTLKKSNYQTIKLSFAKFIVQIGVTHHHSYTIFKIIYIIIYIIYTIRL